MLASIHFLAYKSNLMFFPPLGDFAVGKTTAINQMLEKLESSGAFDVKYGSILGEVLLYNEIKKSRLYILNSKFDLPGKNKVCLNIYKYTLF